MEAILELSEKNEKVRITDLAAKLRVAKASATQAVSSLANLRLVKQERYGPVELTPRGKELASRILKKHRTIRRFLIEVLDIPPEVAEKDACSMEHGVSQQTMEKLAEFLEEWIRTESKALERKDETRLDSGCPLTLNDLAPGMKARIVRLTAKGSLRRRMYDMGMVPGAEVQVLGTAPLGDPIEVTVKGYNLTLRRNEAAQIEVEVE
ncbi:MAG TPA: ferrous iron transporter A [Peptococcaceae bacterium]|nr:ferrous iron transporter A [Peptococcaceae bacterium]